MATFDVATFVIILTFYWYAFAALVLIVVIMRRVLERNRATLCQLGELPGVRIPQQRVTLVRLRPESGSEAGSGRKSAA